MIQIFENEVKRLKVGRRKGCKKTSYQFKVNLKRIKWTEEEEGEGEEKKRGGGGKSEDEERKWTKPDTK